MPKKKTTAGKSMAILPVRGLTVFPHSVIHFDVGRPMSLAALNRTLAAGAKQPIFLAFQKDESIMEPKPSLSLIHI